MRVLHNSRNLSYRDPFGAVAPGTPVELTIDVWDAPGASVQLRTWEDAVGERLFDMEADAAEGDVDAAAVARGDHAAGKAVAEDAGAVGDEAARDEVAAEEDRAEAGCPVRYRVTFTPDKPGIVWYQFIITHENGHSQRYGALPGRVGGSGQVLDWEPPSFQLSVYDPAAEAPVWHAPINGYLHGLSANNMPIDAEDVMFTMLENYPRELCETVLPEGLECPEGIESFAFAGSIADALEAARKDAPGRFACFTLNDDVIGFWRRVGSGALICALFNASVDRPHEVDVPFADAEVTDLLSGYPVNAVQAGTGSANAVEDEAGSANAVRGGVESADQVVRVHLYQLGSSVLHFHARERLQRVFEPGLGVLAHITSIPAGLVGEKPPAGAKGKSRKAASTAAGEAGKLGGAARAFVDQIAGAGVRYWQMLPANPTDEFGSPYAGISAFAGNTRLLEAEGGAVAAGKLTKQQEKDYRAFCEREAAWLEPYVAFMAIREKVGKGKVWQDWPKKYRAFDAALIEGDEKLKASAERYRLGQFAFELQWRDLVAHAHEKNVALIGDMPIYVSSDSADVWAHPEYFQLDSAGRPHVVAGCPPDAFAADGQKWGNPLYDWNTLRETGYDWWHRRLKRAFELYDIVRLDHFIGFSRYFSIPEDALASAGTYHRGPGYEFFAQAYEKLGALPIVAEDLGLLTPGVRSLVADCGFPGMDIVQFVDGNDPLGGYYPRPEKIAYTGTHDNQTLIGYVRERYPMLDERGAFEAICEKVATCGAPLSVFPLQDLMGLGNEARMNVPGVAEGNWVWRAEDADMPQAMAFAKQLVDLHEASRA